MVSSFSNLDLPGPDDGYPSSQQFSGTNYESYNGGELFSGNNSGDNSDGESKTKNEHFLNSAVVLQQKKAFESFVRSIYKDSKEMNRHFESVKSSLGSKLEQVFSPDTMLEYFDRISQKPFSRIANTNKSRWTDDEVLLLTHIVIYYSFANATEFETLPDDAWTYIATIFPNKEMSQLKKRWQGCLKKTLWQIPWTQQEDELLEKIIHDKGHTRKWKEIAEELNACSELDVYRHGRQCRERWNNHLDPNIARGPFTEEEDYRLFQIYKETGKKWAEISKKMKTRTENAVKNRFNSLMKKLKSRQNTTLSENQSMMSIESEPDNAKFEKRLVDQFLQQYEGGGIGSKSQLDKTRTSLMSKSEIPDHDQSESIFESDSESYSQNPKSLNYLDAVLPKKSGNDKDRTRSMGDLNDGFRAFPGSNFHMEEEFPATRGHSNSAKQSKFENSFSGHVEKLEMLSSQNYPYQQQHSLNHPFSQSNILNKTNAMFPESPTRGRSNSVPYQSKLPHAQNLFTNSLFGGNSNLDNLNLSINSLQKNSAKFQPSTMGYKPMGNPLLMNPNADQGGSDSILSNLNQFLECEGSNGNSPLRQNRFPFENYDTKGPGYSQTKLEEEDMNEISPTKRIGDFNHQLKARKLDKYQAQRQIGRANLQYAIVDLTKNEIYMVHPVTKENFNGTISKMNGEDSLLASPFGTPHNNFLGSEFLMLGKSGGGEQSPSVGYLQSLIGKPNPGTEPTPGVSLPNLFNTSADYSDKNKPNSMTLVEQHFQNIRKKFGVSENSEYAFKGKGNNNTQS